ncbi:MAG: EamA family transporter [Flavobacteriales bacterium]|nr:EamA family transporter [Flavobacteriales bacterium]
MERTVVYALLAMLFAGITAVIAKLGMKNVSGDVALALRTTLIFALVWINSLAFRQVSELKLLTRNDALFLGLSGITTFLSWLFYYRAMKDGSVALVSTIDKASIVVTILLSIWILKEPLTWRLAIGGSLILSGLVVLIWK